MYDYLVVGAGLCGCIVARYLAEEKNAKVLILEKRQEIGGNIYDYYDDNQILVQKYGPHIFHTNIARVKEYVQRWCEWKEFKLECSVFMNGKYTPSPFNFSTIDDFFSKEKAEEIKAHIEQEYPGREKATIVEMLQSKDLVVKEYADFLYDNDYKLYTAKQWGISPDEIDISVLQRVPVLFSYKTGYFDDDFQAMPVNGFTAFIEKILDHPNIEVQLGVNAVDKLKINDATKRLVYENEQDLSVIYTGAIDELFSYKHGKLPYRSLTFEWKTENLESYQNAPVVAYPQVDGYTRITEYKKLPPQEVEGKTTIALEYPLAVDEDNDYEPYYPIPTEKSSKQYAMYRSDAEQISNLYLCGRLAEYKYYNMDLAIDRALALCELL